MSTKQSVSRRDFLRNASRVGAALALPTIIPSSALGADGHVAPSNRIVMGAIGVGAKGTANLKSFLKRKDVQVVAVCDVDRERREKTKRTIDDEYGNKDCETYLDFRELIGRGDLDAACTALPDHWHALPAIHAARAGLDVYGEKPLARSIHEGRAMVEAVERAGRVWQTGSQQRSDAKFRQAAELVRNGRLGKVRRVEVLLGKSKIVDRQPSLPVPEGLDWDFWLGPAPWRPYCEFKGKGGKCHWNWRWILDYSGGQLTDWIGHHLDIAHWATGQERSGPVEIAGKGEYESDALSNVPISFDFTCKYADGLEISIRSVYEDLEKGITFFGDDDRWLYVTRGRIDANPKSLLKEPIGANEIHLYKSTDHYGNFIDCVKSRKETVAPIEIGHRSVSVGLLGEIAMLTGRKIKWDPAREAILNDPGAAAMLGRSYREPWVL
jgi:predicted dehydrogenase